MLWVAAAGPGGESGDGSAVGACSRSSRSSLPHNDFTASAQFLMAEAGMTVNLVLMLLNLLPHPAARRRPDRAEPAAGADWRDQYSRLEP